MKRKKIILLEVELIASNRFPRHHVKDFMRATRIVVGLANKVLLAEPIESAYEKFCLMYWPVNSSRIFELPEFEFDDDSRVLVKNVEIDFVELEKYTNSYSSDVVWKLFVQHLWESVNMLFPESEANELAKTFSLVEREWNHLYSEQNKK